jgi:hypothetical protein
MWRLTTATISLSQFRAVVFGIDSLQLLARFWFMGIISLMGYIFFNAKSAKEGAKVRKEMPNYTLII